MVIRFSYKVGAYQKGLRNPVLNSCNLFLESKTEFFSVFSHHERKKKKDILFLRIIFHFYVLRNSIEIKEGENFKQLYFK